MFFTDGLVTPSVCEVSAQPKEDQKVVFFYVVVVNTQLDIKLSFWAQRITANILGTSVSQVGKKIDGLEPAMQESRTDLFLRGERASPTCAEISVIETDVTHCPKQTKKQKKKPRMAWTQSLQLQVVIICRILGF